MLPDRVSNPGPLTYESGALPIALRGPALPNGRKFFPLKVKAPIRTAADDIHKYFFIVFQ